MNTILIIVGIIAIIYTCLRICLLIGIAVYNKNNSSQERTNYMLETHEAVGIDSDFNILPSIEISHSSKYLWIYYKWFCFYYYVDFTITNNE